jgi:beta propeller repeat protein
MGKQPTCTVRQRPGWPTCAILVLVLSVACAGAVLALPDAAPAAPYDVSEFSVCTMAGFQRGVAISGNTVAWADGRTSTTRVFSYDLATHTETLRATPGYDWPYVDVSGAEIVWNDGRTSATTSLDIFGLSLSNSMESPLCTAPDAQLVPSISGTRVVWEDWRNGGQHNGDIYGYDLVSGLESVVCNEAHDQEAPSISGTKVVWMDYRNFVEGTHQHADIYGRDLSTNAEFVVCDTNTGSPSFPRISGTTVVWQSQAGNSDIYGCDLTTNTIFPICVRAGEQQHPAIDGSIVVWVDDRNGNWDIYGYDLLTRTEFPICTDPGWQTGPDVDGSTVVWEDMRLGNFDIYGASLTLPDPVPTISITAPTAANSWPSGSTQTVSWTVSPAVSGGEFRVSLVSQATSTWYVNKSVPAAAAQVPYSTQVIAAVPAGSYKAAVYWKPTGSATWLATKKSAAFTVTPINVTVPAAGAVWPTQATCTVSWNVNPAMAAGEFQVSLINQTSGTWYVNRLVAATAGKVSYSAAVNTLVPPGSYKAAVYWRATVGTGLWTATQKSAAFTIATLAVSDPTASSSWPRLTTQTVAWSVTPGLASGEFRVSLVSAANVWYVNKVVPVVPGQVPYSTGLLVNVPAGAYRAAVYWRPAGSATWVLTKKTAAFTVTP